MDSPTDIDFVDDDDEFDLSRFPHYNNNTLYDNIINALEHYHSSFQLKFIHRYVYNEKELRRQFYLRYLDFGKFFERCEGLEFIFCDLPSIKCNYDHDNSDAFYDFLYQSFSNNLKSGFRPIHLTLLEYVMLMPALKEHTVPDPDFVFEHEDIAVFSIVFSYVDDIYKVVRDSIIEEIKFGRTSALIALFKAKCSHIPLWQEYEKELAKVLNYVPEKIHIIDLANDLDSINSGTCPNIILLAYEHFDSEPLQSLLQNDYIRHLRVDEDEDEEEESDVPIEWKLRMDQKIIANRAHYTITMALLCAQERTPSMRTSCWIWQDVYKYLLY
jgi:hypothetical protein